MLRRSCCLALIVFLLVCQLFMVIYVSRPRSSPSSSFSTNSTSFPGIADTCSLANYSAWDPRIMNYSDVYWERKEFRCEKPEERGYLEQQVLKSRPGYRCKGRCFNGGMWHGLAEFIYSLPFFGMWKEEGTKFDCEFVETECRTVGNDSDSRGSYLSQIIEKPSSPPPPSPKRHNIYVILVDSTSSHQSRRNLPKSLYFMERELEAVEYSYVNKVAANTYPNAISLWYGKTVTDIEKQPLGMNTIVGDWEKICRDPEKAVHIMTEAEKFGYKTLLSENWHFLTFYENWLCASLTRQFRAQHMSPAMFDETLRNKIRPADDCTRFRKTLSEALSYYSQFIKSYKDSPKFGWLWLVIGSHDYETESMLEDTEIYDFFIRHKEELGNSFVFFMSDHGLRFGEQMGIELGEYGSRNPFLSISLPRELRGGRLMENLRKNSRQLQTHYDTRATMLDIIKYQPAVNYTAWKMQQFEEELGHSYLREQPGPRTCHTLPIPFQFCICQYKMERIDSNSKMGKTLANSVLALINGKIIENRLTSSCGMWQLKGEAEMEGYHPINDTQTFRVRINVRQDGWENGTFRTTVRYNGQSRLELIFAARVDRIGSSGACVAKDIREFCYCI